MLFQETNLAPGISGGMAGDDFPDLPPRLAVGWLSETVSLPRKLDRYAAYLASNRRQRHESHLGVSASRQLRHIVLALEGKRQIIPARINLSTTRQIRGIASLQCFPNRASFR